eukprot:1177508-Prorocentrum_minimum.AAC.1
MSLLIRSASPRSTVGSKKEETTHSADTSATTNASSWKFASVIRSLGGSICELCVTIVVDLPESLSMMEPILVTGGTTLAT